MNFENLMKDAEFAKAVEAAEDVKTLAELLRSKGLEVTEEELKAAMDAPEGELDENALEDVAGGSWWSRISAYWAALRYKGGGGGFSYGGGGGGSSGGGGGGGR